MQIRALLFTRFLRAVTAATLVVASALALSPAVTAATINASSQQKTVEPGAVFSVNVYVSSGGESVNSVGGTVALAGDTAEIVGVSKNGSVVNFWTVEPSFTKTSAAFEGVIFNPGYVGGSGRIVTLTLKAVHAGTAIVSVTNGSVLKNDGLGTEAFTGSAALTVTVAEPDPVPVEQPSAATTPAPGTATTETIAPPREEPAEPIAETVVEPYPVTEEVVQPEIASPKDAVPQHVMRIPIPVEQSKAVLPLIGVGFEDTAFYVILFLLVIAAVFAFEVVRLSGAVAAASDEHRHIMNTLRKVTHKRFDDLREDLLARKSVSAASAGKLVSEAQDKIRKDIDALLR